MCQRDFEHSKYLDFKIVFLLTYFSVSNGFERRCSRRLETMQARTDFWYCSGDEVHPVAPQGATVCHYLSEGVSFSHFHLSHKKPYANFHDNCTASRFVVLLYCMLM
jgi:hypothetical protein